MPKQSERSTGPKNRISQEPMAGFGTFSNDMAESYMRASQAMLKNAFDMNQQVLRFASERFHADVAALQALSQCANWQEAANLQSEFVRSTAAAYQAEFSKLVEQGTSANSVLSDLLQGIEKTSSGTAVKE